MSTPESALPIRAQVSATHGKAWQNLAESGAWLRGHERIGIARAARNARACRLCTQRKAALSPYSVVGDHDGSDELPPLWCEVVHRLVTDSGRLTQRWFDGLMAAGLQREVYVEIVGVVASCTILDTFAFGLGLPLATLPVGDDREPTREPNSSVVDAGAWVPLLDVPQEDVGVGLPSNPNILRAMGLVPAAIDLFFPIMRCHYSLSESHLALTRAQVEFIAARVSSHNDCFY